MFLLQFYNWLDNRILAGQNWRSRHSAMGKDIPIKWPLPRFLAIFRLRHFSNNHAMLDGRITHRLGRTVWDRVVPENFFGERSNSNGQNNVSRQRENWVFLALSLRKLAHFSLRFFLSLSSPESLKKNKLFSILGGGSPVITALTQDRLLNSWKQGLISVFFAYTSIFYDFIKFSNVKSYKKEQFICQVVRRMRVWRRNFLPESILASILTNMRKSRWKLQALIARHPFRVFVSFINSIGFFL